MIKRSFFIVWLLLAFSACTVNEPSIPAWDTQWTVVLPTKNVLMSDIIGNDSLLTADTTDSGIPIYHFSLSDSTDWQRVTSQNLAIAPSSKTFDAAIGIIDINKPLDVTTDSIKVGDILPSTLLAYADAHHDTIPPFSDFDLQPADDHQQFNQFKRVKIDSGSIWLTFYNKMFLKIRPGMTINIYNDSPEDGLIGRFYFADVIPPGSVITSSIVDLAGKEIINKIRIEYLVPIAGSDTIMVLDSKAREGLFYSQVSMSKLKVAWAEAKVPPQQFSRQDSVDISQEKHHLQQADIQKGRIRVSLTNNMPLNARVRFVLPDFQKDGQLKTVSAEIPAGQLFNQTIRLDGWTLLNHENPGGYVDFITYQLTANVDSSDGYVVIASNDSVSVNVDVDSLFFSSLEGTIDTVKMNIEPTVVDGPDFFSDYEGGIRLDDLVMTMDFENQIDFPVNVNLNIVGEHEENSAVTKTVAIPLQRTIQQSSVSPHTSIVLDKNSTTPSIVDLLEILPSKIRVSGQADIEGHGSVSVGQGTRVSFKIESPLTIQLKNPLQKKSEVDSIRKDDLGDEDRQLLSEDIQDAYAQFTLSNGIPIGAKVTLYMATDSTQLDNNVIADSSRKWIIEGMVSAGKTDAGGFVSEKTISEITISLSKEKLQLLSHSPIYVRQVVEILPTAGVVRFRQNDELNIGALVKIKYTMNKQDK